MQPTQNQVTDPITGPVTTPTATPVATPTAVPSVAAIERQTPARVLRAAAGYLHQFGWWQGDLFDDPEQPTPCACPLGAIRMAVMGTAEIGAEQLRADLLAAFHAAVAVLADHLIGGYGEPVPVTPYGVLFPGDLEQVVVRWNDHPNRNVGQVIAALNGAADEWDRIHDAAVPVEGAGPFHVDYPHEDGALYDCPACEAACFCRDGVQCVRCAILAEETAPCPTRSDRPTSATPVAGGAE